MKKESRTLALTAVVATCLAFLFIYSWCYAEPITYSPDDIRQISPTVVLGAALLLSLVSLFSQIRKR